MKERKSEYRIFCKHEKSIPIFSKDWWLDAVCGDDNWDVIIIKKGQDIVATLPYYLTKGRLFTTIGMPSLTQTLGPWLRVSKTKYADILSEQKKLMTEIIIQLPPFDYFVQNFHYSITNWLPFSWKGFSQTTLYTYVIENLTDLDLVWRSFQANIRSDVRKAQKCVKIKRDLDVDTFLNVSALTFQRQGRLLPYSRAFVHRLDMACKEQDACQIFYALDSRNRIHAVAYIVWDDNSAFYLMGGGDPALRNSGATSLVMWEAIQFASTVTKKFDFEGSMIEPVERFFRAFGARQIPYFNINKITTKYKMMSYGKTAIREIVRLKKGI